MSSIWNGRVSNVASNFFIHSTAEVSPTACIGAGSKVWNHAQVREEAQIGECCIVGKDVYIDHGVRIGNRVKIQNSVSIYHGVSIADDVFIGPHVSFTNDKFPRAKNANWVVVPTVVEKGASLGANCTIVCGVTIGEEAMVGAGSVVTRDVPARCVVVGNPARIQRFIGSQAPLSIMLIGFGAMGKRHAHTISSLPQDFELSVIADLSEDQRHQAQKSYPRARVVADYSSKIEQVDVAIIATPAGTHYSIAQHLLSSGKHCLIEKPCTCDVESTDKLFQLAKQQGVVLQVGHTERFNPAVCALFDQLGQEQVIMVTAERWGLSTRESDSDVVLDLMIHDLELVCALLRQTPVDIQAQEIGSKRGEAASALVRFCGGATAVFSASRVTPKRHRVLHVTTDRAHYEIDYVTHTLRKYPGTDTTCGMNSSIVEFRGQDPLTAQALSFVQSIREKSEPAVGRTSVLNAIQLATQIRLKLGR